MRYPRALTKQRCLRRGRGDRIDVMKPIKRKRPSSPATRWTRTQIPRAGSLVLPSGNGRIEECYASVVGPCSGKISGEHSISSGIVKKLASEGDGSVRVRGMHWQEDGAVKNLGPPSLVANVLCQGHNSALSPIDNVGIAVFEAFRRLIDTRITGSEEVTLWGPDFELWILKALTARAVGGELENAGRRRAPRAVPADWPLILFGSKPMAAGCGLYISAKEITFDAAEPSFGVAFQGMFDGPDEAVLCGGRSIFTRIGDFTLMMRPHSPSDDLEPERLRPASVTFSGPRSLRLCFEWPDRHRGRHASMTWFPRAAPS